MVRKIRRRAVNGILVLALGGSLFTGCSLQKQQEIPEVSPTETLVEPTSPAQVTPEAPTQKGFRFVYHDVKIAVDMPAAGILAELGPWDTYFEAASCAMEGMVRTYGYGSFELDTYELEGKEYIAGIYFKDDTVTTEEGAYLFMTEEQLVSLYGEELREESGMLVYYKDGQKLKFLITDGEVSLIQYMSVVADVVQ